MIINVSKRVIGNKSLDKANWKNQSVSQNYLLYPCSNVGQAKTWQNATDIMFISQTRKKRITFSFTSMELATWPVDLDRYNMFVFLLRINRYLLGKRFIASWTLRWRPPYSRGFHMRFESRRFRVQFSPGTDQKSVSGLGVFEVFMNVTWYPWHRINGTRYLFINRTRQFDNAYKIEGVTTDACVTLW